MAPKLRIRNAVASDVPQMTRLSIAAFRGRPMNDAMFPEHLRQRPGDIDREEVIGSRFLASLGKPGRHVILVVEEDDEEDGAAELAEGEEDGRGRVLATAQWDAVPGPLVQAPEEKAKALGGLPASFDKESLKEIEREGLLLDQTIRDAMGQEEYDNSWCKLTHSAICYNAGHGLSFTFNFIGYMSFARLEAREQQGVLTCRYF